MARNIL